MKESSFFIRKKQTIVNDILSKLAGQITNIDGFDILLISSTYPGLWMEHIYDSVFYAQMDQTKLYLAENAIRMFIKNQKSDGQLPFAVIKDGSKTFIGYSQIQECVSFGSLCLKAFEMNHNMDFLKTSFEAVKKWVAWLKKNRMTQNKGLIEMFCGYDTGHDYSARVLDLAFPGNYRINNVAQNAAILPPDDIAPVIAVDMNCNFYGNLKSLAVMAEILGIDSTGFHAEAKEVKEKLFEICFDEDACFFFDVDRHGRKRRILSSQILHLFMEGVLDQKDDAKLIEDLCRKYIFNENHFYTLYPFPAVSISDPTWKKHTPKNCWGYFTQSLLVLRTTLWMEKYGFTKEFQRICAGFFDAWSNCYETLPLGQELDPLTGEPSQSSPWYSTCMLMYLYISEKRL